MPFTNNSPILIAHFKQRNELENPSWPTLIERCAEMLKPNAVAKLRAKARRDLSRENSILFVRHALGFRDFWTACKYGDIGRCLNMLDLW
jgi:hypothetical protein